MSGIAGYWSYAAYDIPPAVFTGFLDGLKHRGPDGSGIDHFPDVRLWLGHRRLDVADRARDPRQPLADPQRRYWLSFDGAIHNDGELRDELRALDHRFVSDATSETVLAAYAQWAEDCLKRFSGMWALAIWDARERRLLLARDNFGIKPLHYIRRNGVVAFASELKAFLRLPWIDDAFDPEIVATTLDNLDEQEASPLTMLPGVHRLLPGHAVTITAAGEVRSRRWWNLLDHLPQPADELSHQAAEFRPLLLDACKLCLRADAPVGIEQSGGLDSSAIACSVAALDGGGARPERSREARHAFIACANNARHDEEENARIVAAHAGMKLQRVDVDDRDALAVIERVIFDHEIVFGFPRVGAWMLYRAMRASGIRVSLGEIGIDDILGSDTDYVEAALDRALRHLNLVRYYELRRVLRGMAGGNIEIGRATAWGELRWLLRSACAALHLLGPLRPFLRLPLKPSFLRFPAPTPVRRDDFEELRRVSFSSLDAKRYKDFCRITPLYLANFDRASAAHGIEARFPFMDQQLVAYAFALPERSRNGDGCTKRVLRLATEELIPDAIRLRTRKTAFTVPLDDWSRGALKPWLLDLCASRSFLENDVWHGPAVREFVERAVAGTTSLSPVWPILQCHALQRSFAARAGDAAHGREATLPACEPETQWEMAAP
ncbi:MAG TPA: asparagine synthase (glutamine-hydrolyzing) [Stellaceae bacterium]|nr:asparagine synthase (glutamine-hydrolyzing) [Stellaceae bacterium]